MPTAFLPSYTSARHLALRHFDDHPGRLIEEAASPSVAQYLFEAGLIETQDGKRPRHFREASFQITEQGQAALRNWSAIYAPVRPDPVEIDSAMQGD